MNCSRHAPRIPLANRFSTRWIYRSAKIYHLRIVFLLYSDELFELSGAAKYSIWGSLFNESWSQRWIVSGKHHIKYSISGSFFYAMNCSRRTTYFHCRIVFHTRIVPGTPRISFQDRISTRWIVPGAQQNSAWESFFFTMNCFRRTKIFHFRLSFFYAMNCSWIKAAWLAQRIQKYTTKTWGSLNFSTRMSCFRHATHFLLGIVFLPRRIVQRPYRIWGESEARRPCWKTRWT